MAAVPAAVYSDAPYKRVPVAVDVQDLYIRGVKLGSTGGDVGQAALLDEHDTRLDALEASNTTINSTLLLKEDKSNKGAASGYAGLNSSAKLPITTIATIPKGGVLTSADGTTNSILTVGTSGQLLSATAGGALAWTTPAAGLSLSTTKGNLTTANGSAVTNLAVGTNGSYLVADSSQTNGLRWAGAGQTLTSGGIVAVQRLPIPPFGSNSSGTKTIFSVDVTSQAAYSRCFHFEYTILYFYEIGGVGHYKGRATVIANSTSTTGTKNQFGAAEISKIDSAASGVTFASSISGNNWVITTTVPNAVGWVFGGFVDATYVDE
jgi:hypothetical protein